MRITPKVLLLTMLACCGSPKDSEECFNTAETDEMDSVVIAGQEPLILTTENSIRNEVKLSYYDAMVRVSEVSSVFNPNWTKGDTISFTDEESILTEYNDSMIDASFGYLLPSGSELKVVSNQGKYIQLQLLKDTTIVGFIETRILEMITHYGQVRESKADFYDLFSEVLKAFQDSIKTKYNLNDSQFNSITRDLVVNVEQDWKKNYPSK